MVSNKKITFVRLLIENEIISDYLYNRNVELWLITIPDLTILTTFVSLHLNLLFFRQTCINYSSRRKDA